MNRATNAESLAVVIVNWNRRDDLRQLLRDLRSQIELPDEIVVVDNGSTDGAPEMVEADFPEVHLIRRERNEGLSRGRNVGIAAAATDMICVLDNDIRILDRRFFARLRKSLRCHADAGVISFEQVLGLWKADPPRANAQVFSLPQLEEIAAAGDSPFRTKVFYDWFFWGGACVIRKRVIDAVGDFDEVFSYGGEEWDFAYRCHAAGILLLRDRNLWVVHVHSPTMRSPDVALLILKNMIIAQCRYMPWSDAVIFLTFQLGKSLWTAVRRGSLRGLMCVLSALSREWRPEVLRKRRPVTRSVMRRFYFLRLSRTSDLSYATNGVSAVSYYVRRMWQGAPESLEPVVYAAMVPLKATITE